MNRMNHFRITQPILNSVMHSTLSDDVYLDEKSFALLLEIQKTLSVFEPIEDDEARKLWLEIPRGSAEEWKAFDDAHSWYSDDLEGYQEALDEDYPRDTEWFFMVTSTYREYTFLKISDRDYRYVIFTNRSFHKDVTPSDMTWLLEPLLTMVQERVAAISKDPDTYNRHIEKDLPYRQRSGQIKSKDLNRIIPERRLEVEDREFCIKVMEELLLREKVYESTKDTSKVDWKSKGVPAPFDTMTIRTFCKYYRIADGIFQCGSEEAQSKMANSTGSDVDYYSRHGLHHNLDDLDCDSEKAFQDFAQDHYGELGLSRMNVRATNHYAGGKWIISFSISYSASVETGLKIAMALYKTRAPFVFYDANNLLHILKETGQVRILPFTFHDYIGGGDDEGVFDLPYIEDCDKEGEITRKQYDEIVRLAKWEPDVKLKLDAPIPLYDAIYDLIRDEADAPMTLSEIRRRIENKYDTYLSVYRDDGDKGYYYIKPSKANKYSDKKSNKHYPTFNEAMKALILSIKDFKLD